MNEIFSQTKDASAVASVYWSPTTVKNDFLQMKPFIWDLILKICFSATDEVQKWLNIVWHIVGFARFLWDLLRLRYV